MDDLHAFLAGAARNAGPSADDRSADGRTPFGRPAANGAPLAEAGRAGSLDGPGADTARTSDAAGNGQPHDATLRQLQQARALRRISADITSKLDLEVILSDLVDHARVLFGADRAAVFERERDGRYVPRVARNISDRYLALVDQFPLPSLSMQAVAERRPLFAVDYANDPRGAGARAAVVEEGFDTQAVAPLLADEEVLGVLILYHDAPHPWDATDLEALDALAAQASIAIVNARNYAQMAGWAAHLQSIQKLGARLSRLSTVDEIGAAIAAELRQLIDYHNVRVYRVEGDNLHPLAWRGDIGEYTEYEEEQLRLTVGEGITGWVARHGVAQYLPDAAKDPRASTIPGTQEDLEESMLVAPMTYENRVIGVLVLSKLGVDQFTADDLRLLEIYASFAAQAISNADATERLNAQSRSLERQLRSQRELLRITESILTTLDPRVVLLGIADRLGTLVTADSLALYVCDPSARLLRPLMAKGNYTDLFMSRPLTLDEGVIGWVATHGVAQLVPDALADPRVHHFEELGPLPGAIIAVPLRGREGTPGVLFLERLGPDASFSAEEFELVQLFAGHASIAIQNAEIHRAVEIRAQTDALTGVANHGTFHDRLTEAVSRGRPFSLLMLDLDEFKRYNDSLGHQAGDALLKGIARALEAAGREADEVFRYGGDEFALILPDTDARGRGALAVAEKVRKAVASVAESLPHDPRRPSVTCSIGVATYPFDGTDKDAILLAADRACYLAKRTGRDRVATAAEGRALVGEFLPTAPTPVDEPTRHPPAP